MTFATDSYSTAELSARHETLNVKAVVWTAFALRIYEVTMNKIKLLALDLDGTTLTSKNTLTPAVKSALEKAIANGITVAIATGRPLGTMPQSILDIKGIDYLITSNGAAIYDKSRKKIHSATLKENDVLKILDVMKDEDIISEAFVDGLTYTDKRYSDNPLAYGCTEAYIDYVKASHGHIEDMRKFIFEHKNELDSIEYISTDPNTRKRIWSMLENAVDNIFITTSSEHFIELMDKSATKASALSHLANILGIDMQNTCACGNADNDADMIAESGFGAAVDDASRKCIECADYVVPDSDNDGVDVLIDYILSNC